MGIDFSNSHILRIYRYSILFGISGFMGIIVRKFSGFMGTIFRNFTAFIGGTFCDLEPRCLEKSSDPTRGAGAVRKQSNSHTCHKYNESQGWENLHRVCLHL